MCTLYCEWMCVIWILDSGVIRYHNLFLCWIWEIPCFAEVYQDKKSKVGGKWHSTSITICCQHVKLLRSLHHAHLFIEAADIIGIDWYFDSAFNTSTSRPTSPGSHIIPPAPSEGPLVQGNQAWRSHPPAETVDATSDITGSQSG